MGTVDRELFMQNGYLVLRDVVSSDELNQLRTSYEVLLDRQKEIWTAGRGPDDPPGGAWDSAPQPRVQLFSWDDQAGVQMVDESTINVVEFWLSEDIKGAAEQLLSMPVAASSEISLMCNPTFDYGPAPWHRDVHPIDMGPMASMQEALVEHGPTYVQWNVPLYDDDVLWVVPGSHARLNTDVEDRHLRKDPRVPLPGGVPVELAAGDAIVYINYILHWGSDYSTRAFRRTMTSGHTIFPSWSWQDLVFTHYMATESGALFEGWARRVEHLKATTERCLRAVLVGDRRGYLESLKVLHPVAGPKGQLQLTIWLCKAAMMLHLLKRSDYHDVPWDFRRRTEGRHGITLNWGPAFAERFTKREADTIWAHFNPLEDRLKAAAGEDYVPGYQSGPIPYYLEAMREPLALEELTACVLSSARLHPSE